jgi:hypothetical protein
MTPELDHALRSRVGTSIGARSAFGTKHLVQKNHSTGPSTRPLIAIQCKLERVNVCIGASVRDGVVDGLKNPIIMHEAFQIPITNY